MSEKRSSKAKWSSVESEGNLYLFTPYSPQDYEDTKGYFSSRPIPGKPLSREDCIRLATILLNHANRKGR